MKILVLAAHPDDEVLGMGGTIKKLSKKGNDIKIIFMSTGILSRRKIEPKHFQTSFYKRWMKNNESKVKSLRDDAKKAGKILGVKSIGAARTLNIFLILFLKLLSVVLSYQFTKISKLSKEAKILFFTIFTSILISMSSYAFLGENYYF